MLNSTLLKTIALAAFLGGSLTLSVYPAQALSATTAQQSTLAVTPTATKTMTKQEQAPIESPNLDEIAPISDQELVQFTNALTQIQVIQASYNTQVASVVETEGLSPERFDQILMVVRSPQEAAAENIPEVSEEEAGQFQRTLVQIGAIQDDTRSQMQQAIQEEGLALERFQEIIIVVNSDEDLEGRVRQMIETSSDEQS
ncbi:MAG: DUF4168 domain-containing protein [Elainellaceae cyanobacterium]